MALKHSTLTPKHPPRHRQANQAPPRHLPFSGKPPRKTQQSTSRNAKQVTETSKNQSSRAGEGNRTLTTSLEGWSSAIELHPHKLNPSTPAQTAQHAVKAALLAVQPKQLNQTNSTKTALPEKNGLIISPNQPAETQPSRNTTQQQNSPTPAKMLQQNQKTGQPEQCSVRRLPPES